MTCFALQMAMILIGLTWSPTDSNVVGAIAGYDCGNEEKRFVLVSRPNPYHSKVPPRYTECRPERNSSMAGCRLTRICRDHALACTTGKVEMLWRNSRKASSALFRAAMSRIPTCNLAVQPLRRRPLNTSRSAEFSIHF
jgi:hypothetical protein